MASVILKGKFSYIVSISENIHTEVPIVHAISTNTWIKPNAITEYNQYIVFLMSQHSVVIAAIMMGIYLIQEWQSQFKGAPGIDRTALFFYLLPTRKRYYRVR